MTTATHRMKTRTIAGQTFTLTTGCRYLASRPMAMPGVRRFDVTIRDITLGINGATSVTVVRRLDYQAANELLRAFNNGPMSFDGRVWR